MRIMNRRSFLGQSSRGALGIALGSMLNVPGFLRDAVADGTGITWNGKKILFVFLRGGNDALNTVIPVGDSAYNTVSRPSLHIPGPASLTTTCQAPVNPAPGEAIDLGNGFAALHPSLRDLIPLYNAGELAVLHRVGYPNQSRSHFDSQNYWETGVPRDDSVGEGLFYRALIETGLHESQLLPGVSFTSTLPLSLRGDLPMANINDPSRYDLLGVYGAARQKHIDHIARMHGLPRPQKKSRDLLFPTGERFVESIGQVEGVDFDANGLDGGGVKIPGSPFLDDDVAMTHLFPVSPGSDDKLFDNYGAFNFFRSLKYSAQVLAETDAVIAGVELGGFDTHSDQGGANGGLDGSHARLLSYMGWSMYSLKKYLQHPSVNTWDDTLVVMMSEFGRTTDENDSSGTDHAEAGVMFCAGGNPSLNGGVYACSDTGGVTPCDVTGSSLNWATGAAGAMYEEGGRYLSRRIDYRSVLGEIIREHLGAPSACLGRIIPGYADPAEKLVSGGTSIDGIDIFGEVGLFS